MRAYKTTSAALAVALSGSLALGVAGTAAAAPAHAPATARAAAPADTETTVQQFRVIERLGELAELTGALGRLSHDTHTNPLVLRALQDRLQAQTKRVAWAVDRARTATLPAPVGKSKGDTGTKAPKGKLQQAVQRFEKAVDDLVNVDASDTKARTTATNALVRNLAAVNTAAMKRAGMPVKQAAPKAALSPRSAAEGTTHTMEARQPRDVVDAPFPYIGWFDTGRLFDNGVLEDTDDVIDPVGDLIDAILEAPGGRLTDAQIDQHSKALEKAFSPVQRQVSEFSSTQSARDGHIRITKVSNVRSGTLDELRKRAHALLRASRDGDLKKMDTAAGALLKYSVGYLADTTGSYEMPDSDALRFPFSAYLD